VSVSVDAGGIDVAQLMEKFAARKFWLLTTVVIFTIGFVTVAVVMTPVYRATTVMVDASVGRSGLGLDSALGQLGGLASLAGVDLNAGGDPVEESIAVLESREFSERFIAAENLMIEFFGDRWDPATRTWKGEPESWPTPAQAFRRFDSAVRKVSRDQATSLIELQIDWKDPAKAARWANLLIERLNEEMRQRAIAASTASIGYLEQELDGTSAVETRQAINRLMETQINQRMLATVTREYAFRVVDRALPPDRRDYVRPNKLLLFALGPIIGLIFGMILVLLADALAPRQPRLAGVASS
jgi:uncharacterized protein involved in exopolysaccharide biosynthesis